MDGKSFRRVSMTDDQLYNAIWETAGKHVGYGIDCDVLTDQIWDLLLEDARDTARRRSTMEKNQ
jgi:hypothetical protein